MSETTRDIAPEMDEIKRRVVDRLGPMGRALPVLPRRPTPFHGMPIYAHETPMGRRRAALGLTMEQVARRVGMSRAIVQRWEAGDGMPKLSSLPRLARGLDVSITEALGWFLPEAAAALPAD